MMPTHGTTPARVAATDSTPAAGMAPNERLAAGMAPDERLAVAFGKRVGRWSGEQGASAAVAKTVQRVATLVSQATSNGHSCARLDELADSLNTEAPMTLTVATLRMLLLESKVVGVPQAPESLPLILDDERLYLHRYFDYECRLASSLAARNVDRSGAIGANTLPANVLALLDRLFGANALESDAPDWQRIAAITALLGRVTIISGGPGTGKTTTVVNLLACLLEADPDCRIALTAPTGKAAARLTEVILQRAGHVPDALRAKLPTESSTIHRLLGGTMNGDFRYDAANPLPIDVLVVDEASMLDLALAVRLIEAVPENARIILLGDKDQLAAVESGAVFSELSAHPTFSPQRIETLSQLSGVTPQMLRGPPLDPSARGLMLDPSAPGPTLDPSARGPTLDPSARGPTLDPSATQGPQTGLEDSVIWLRRNYRFAAGSAIGLLAAETRDGNATRVLEQLEHPSDPSLVWFNDGGSVPSTDTSQAILDGYSRYIGAVRSNGADPGTITAAFARFRVLCAVRDGPWGVNAINQQLSVHFRRTLQHPLDPGLRSEWYPGRPVMVLRNDHVLKLFNGDIGIVLPDPLGVLQVYFPDESGGFRAISPVRLPDHETAFAMTVHKAQGSEFEEILLVLPAEKSRILTRELLYTAVTRARERLTIVANATVVGGTIETATKRVSGLLARVRRCGSLCAVADGATPGCLAS
jgi:exodeoxyribonuclease V alpha subunit